MTPSIPADGRPEQECSESVRSACAHHFRDVANQLGEVAKGMALGDQRMRGIEAKLDTLNKVLLGNGEPECGLFYRFGTLETRLKTSWASVCIVAGIVSTAATLIISILF